MTLTSHGFYKVVFEIKGGLILENFLLYLKSPKFCAGLFLKKNGQGLVVRSPPLFLSSAVLIFPGPDWDLLAREHTNFIQ